MSQAKGTQTESQKQVPKQRAGTRISLLEPVGKGGVGAQEPGKVSKGWVAARSQKLSWEMLPVSSVQTGKIPEKK